MRLNITLGIAAMLLLMGIAIAARAESSQPRLVRIDTASYCGPCKQMKATLKAQGVTLIPVKPSGQHPAAYPTCHYSDGRTDFGGLYFSAACSVGRTVEVAQWE